MEISISLFKTRVRFSAFLFAGASFLKRSADASTFSVNAHVVVTMPVCASVVFVQFCAARASNGNAPESASAIYKDFFNKAMFCIADILMKSDTTITTYTNEY